MSAVSAPPRVSLAQAMSPATRRAALAGFMGSLLEWYDFYLFGTAAALVFGPLFFPNSSPAAGTLAAFATFAIGFIARPIGAVLFGHIGDRIGRKYALLATALLMGGGTFLIGLLPTYDSIGVWAPALLVVLRLAQGLGIGGEWGGAALIALEHAPRGWRGLIGTFPQMGTPFGLLLSTGAFGLSIAMMSNETFMAWGWRVPFLLSIVFMIPALYIRSHVEESPVFRRAADAFVQGRKRQAIPVVDLFRHHRRNLLLATGARLADAATFNVINVFGIAYASRQLGVSRELMLSGFVIAAAVEVAVLPLIGALSDRIGRKPVYLAGVMRQDHDAVVHLEHPTEAQLRRQREHYCANVTMIDAQMGLLMDALRRRGVLDDTVIIFTSDHGDCLNDHGHSQKWTMYEQSVRVPAIIWAPGRAGPAREVDSLVSLFDLGPTVLDFAGATVPDWMEASSLMPFLSGVTSAEGRRYVFAEHARDAILTETAFMTMIRDRHWKLVTFVDSTEGQLFDLEADAEERRNLWPDPAYASIRRDLLDAILRWRIESDLITSGWTRDMR